MTPPLFVPALGRSLYPGASVALDFTRNLYRSGTPVVKGSPSLLSGWTFSRASTGYAETAAGALVAFASGAPRITDKGLLVEESRTNLCPNSEDLSNATTFAQNQIAVTLAAGIAPNGTLTANKLVGTAVANTHNAGFAPSGLSDSTDYTGSIFAKAGEWTWLQLIIRSKDSATETGAYFNLSAGTVGTTDAGITASILALANGWYRCIVKKNMGTGATTPRFRIAVTNADAAAAPLGDGTSGIYVWGAQLEAGSFATSYVPTTTASATRAADVATIATTSLAYPLTLVAEWIAVTTGTATRHIFQVNTTGSNADRALLRVASNQTVRALMTTANVEQGAVQPPGSTGVGTVYKQAGRFATNDLNAALGGSSGTADATATLPATPTEVIVGSSALGTDPFNGYVRRALVYPTAFTDAQLQAATAT